MDVAVVECPWGPPLELLTADFTVHWETQVWRDSGGQHDPGRLDDLGDGGWSRGVTARTGGPRSCLTS